MNKTPLKSHNRLYSQILFITNDIFERLAAANDNDGYTKRLFAPPSLNNIRYHYSVVVVSKNLSITS